jgi:hypothetical protein
LLPVDAKVPLVVDAHVFNAARRAPDPLSEWLKVK